MTTAVDINHYLKTRLGSHGTKMKRQKILYYAQAWHLAWYGTPLFEDEIRAWDKGPVTVSVFVDETYKPTGSSIRVPSLEKQVIEHLDAILGFYGDKSGTQLSALTHDEEPWKKAYQEKLLGEVGVISKNAMFKYYSAQDCAPCKPKSIGRPVSDKKFLEALLHTRERFKGVDRILADR